MSKRSDGFVLHETIMALALAMAVVVGIAELLALVAQQRRAAGQYAVAVAEAGNLMEDLVSRPWLDTTAERLAQDPVEPSETLRRRLPEANVAVEVADEQSGVQRITVRIDWRRLHGLHEEGSRCEPVRLVGWKFRDEEA